LSEKTEFENCEKNRANSLNVCAEFYWIFQSGFELQNLDVKSYEQAPNFGRQRKMPETELVKDV
jgi:hypothetical protein